MRCLTNEAIEAIHDMVTHHEITPTQAADATEKLRSKVRAGDLIVRVLVDIASALVSGEHNHRFREFASIMEHLIHNEFARNEEPLYAPVHDQTFQALTAVREMEQHRLITPRQAADARRNLRELDSSVDLKVKVLVDIAGALIVPRSTRRH